MAKKGASANKKGKAAEREVIGLIQPILDELGHIYDVTPFKLTRNLNQARDGGSDILGLPWFSIEVKRHEHPQIAKWWKQTVEAATNGEIPVLIYRKSHCMWKVQWEIDAVVGWLPGTNGPRTHGVIATTSLTDFNRWLKKRVALYYEIQKLRRPHG